MNPSGARFSRWGAIQIFVPLPLSDALGHSCDLKYRCFVFTCSRSSGRILPFRDIQRELRAPARSRGRDDVSAVRTYEVRPVYEGRPRQCGVFCRRPVAARSSMFWSSHVSCYHSRRCPAQCSPLSQRTHALLGGQLFLCPR